MNVQPFYPWLKTEARILGFGNVGVWNTELVTELVTEFTGDQLEMINEAVVEAITGAIMAMIFIKCVSLIY